ncbi:MAG: hypothetical protein GX628_11180 [Clostridiales bacterium]|nr:hypothetical protein [Clostridiales bacterium]
MKERTFLTLLFILLAVCVLVTAAHLIWAVWAYNHCSIIYFIAHEMWQGR